MEPKDSDFYKYRKYDPSSEKYTIICPLCKNEKSINIIFSIKCPRCNGVGYIKITTDKYDSLVKKRIQKLKKLEQNKPKFRSLVLEDKRTINF
jgi:RecJ-like exonuclease